jgi:sugar phosphate isomerase/epimerase
MHRRDVLAALAAGAALPIGWPRRAAAAPATGPLGIQLYTVRDLLAEDFDGTLRALARIGYREVEFAGYHGRAPAEIRRVLAAQGLRASSAHLPLESLQGDASRTFEAAYQLGHEHLVVAWVPPEARRDVDDWRRLADRFNEVGYACRAAGFKFAYHNHDFEFAPLGDLRGYDVLIERTEPGLVTFELDLYWITRGGADPLEYLARLHDRVPMVHVKDMDATPERGMTDPGQGILDFRALLARARASGTHHFFVEHDQPADPLRTARTGYRYLRSLGL